MKRSVSVLLLSFSLVFLISSCDYENAVNEEPAQKEKGIKNNYSPTLAYIEMIPLLFVRNLS